MQPQVQSIAVCQICLHPICEGEETAACPDCKTSYHRECRDELGGCATYGCVQMVEIRKTEEPADGWWGTSEKKCPMCAETIPVSSLECPYCHTAFDEIRPISREELLTVGDDSSKQAYRKRAICLLIFSVAGVTSPLALLIGGLWYLARREQIGRAGPMIRATVLMSLAICLVWIVIVAGGYAVFRMSAVNQPGGSQ